MLAALQNKNAKPLVQEALSNVIACVDYAVSDMEAKMAEAESDPADAYGGSTEYVQRFAEYIKIAKENKDQFEQLQNSLAGTAETTRSN